MEINKEDAFYIAIIKLGLGFALVIAISALVANHQNNELAKACIAAGGAPVRGDGCIMPPRAVPAASPGQPLP